MACIVKVTDKRSGLTYAYRSESYWDKEKKAPRSRRTLIGRVNPATGEIEPTDGRRRRAMEKQRAEDEAKEQTPEQNKHQSNCTQSDVSTLVNSTVDELHVLVTALTTLTHCIENIISKVTTENQESNTH